MSQTRNRKPNTDRSTIRERLVSSERAFLGWGLLTSWGLVSWTLDSAPIPGGIPMMNAVISSVCIVTCLIVIMVYRSGHHDLWVVGIWKPAMIWVPAIVMAICSIADQVTIWLGLPYLVPTILQAISSVAYVIFMYLWFCVYISSDPQTIENRAIWSTALCAAVVLVSIAVFYPVRAALWVALPLLSAGCLKICRAGSAQGGIVGETAMREGRQIPVPVETKTEHQMGDSVGGALGQTVGGHAGKGLCRQVLMVVPGIVLCNIAIALPQGLAGYTALAGKSLLTGFSNIGGLVLAAVLVFWYIMSARRIELRSFYKVLYPLTAVGLFLIVVPQTALCFMGFALCNAAEWLLYVFIWIYSAEACHRAPASSAVAFGSMRAAFEMGNLIAAMVTIALAGVLNTQQEPSTLLFVLFGGLVIFTLAAALPSGVDDFAAGEPQSGTPEQAGGEEPADCMLYTVIDTRANLLAERYALSEREKQIFIRLLRGYSTAAIRNELVVAKGTVDTYIQRIYRKCDVHSRQELIELAEGRDGNL